MLEIIVPKNNIPEREFIIRTLFSDFLGLSYHIAFSDSIQHYAINFDDRELLIRDCFFNLYPKDLSYLTTDALPKKTVFLKNEFTIEKDIPVIYGTSEMAIEERKIILGIDIFASSFFMLTRWEEYISKQEDEHSRFPYNESIAFKNDFLHRPGVNEYIEMLWKIILKLGYKVERKKRSYNLILTHDIDYMSYPLSLRNIYDDIIKRRNLKLSWNHIQYAFPRFNPYNSFGFIMDVSEKWGLKSHFYFMSSDVNRYPDTPFYINSKVFKEKIKEIKARGHIIGFHPGYYSYNDYDKWVAEKQMLEKAAEMEIVEGRQHYLRLDFPLTFRIWEKSRMQIDSTLGYAHKEGFRCGTGDLFYIFDFIDRRQMNIRECPLIIMDRTLNRQYAPDKSITVIRDYISVAQKYNSAITLLFHNSSFFGDEWEGYDAVYKKALEL